MKIVIVNRRITNPAEREKSKVIEINTVLLNSKKMIEYYFELFYHFDKQYVYRVLWNIKAENEVLSNLVELLKKDEFSICKINWNIYPLTIENVMKERQDDDGCISLVIGKEIDFSKINSRFIFDIRVQFRGKIFPTYLWPLERDSRKYEEAHGGVSAKTDYSYVTWPTKIGTPFISGYEGNEAVVPDSEKEKYLFESYNSMFHSDYRTNKEFRIQVSELEKVLFHIQYQDPELLGTDREDELNGKEEWLELDLQDPDMEVYKKMQVLEPRFWIKWED